ncbi:unnamed protein product [Rotaria magnacalcarata]|uniref:Protein quiver n=3 Tax=Rotaria magnacalcarata TaxID=392030 RepID=A0A814SCE1_9BILA|nr:unnamed protein product [Rotaria magnacalcarata]CAF2044804.1 unnamed protein product [Rotaria magnacalcarata]CAF2101258.1 unnamed protein product [Rotaria magnacalcarata]CAF2152040.1 unnamed protein product [Rotaria magnacalcarata]CAF3753565.1 unnamed protein product [Rotaria magnacalcarata]
MKFLTSIYLSICIHQLRTILVVVAKETCTMAKFVCYQCDSRVDDYCGDPFKVHRANRTVECSDYCVKFFHFDGKSTNDTFVRRGCLTDYFLYRLSKIDVCYRHTTGSNFTIGRFCMCAKEMCNRASFHKTTSLYFTFLITFQLLLLSELKTIFS